MSITQPFDPFRLRATGAAFNLVPGRDSTGKPWAQTSELQRAPDSGGSPGTWATIMDNIPPLPGSGGIIIDQRPMTTELWWYRWRHTGASVDPGAWSASFSARSAIIPKDLLSKAINAQNGVYVYPLIRQEPLADGDFVARAVDPSGEGLKNTVGVSEGGAIHKIYRHREEITVNSDADGDVAVTFAQSYQNVPMVLFKGGQYVSFSNVLGTSVKQRLRIQALNLTSSGFTSRAQITNPGATTAQTDDFASGNLLDAAGETAEVNLDPGGANDDTYTVNYRVSVTVDQHPTQFCTATLVVAIDTNAQDGSGWIERATYSYAVSNVTGPPPFEAATTTWDTESKGIIVTGLGTNDDIRIRAKSFSVSNGGTGSFAVRGADAGGSNPDTRNGVTYTTASDTVESAIPSAGDTVTWVAQEVV